MAETTITDKIIESARTRGEEIIREARTAHDKDQRERLDRLRHEFEELRAQRRRNAEEAMQQEASRQRMAQRKTTLNLKRQLIEEVYQAVWDQVSEGAKYRNYLARQLEAHGQTGDQIVVSSRERDLFAGNIKDLLEAQGVLLSEVSGRFMSGFVIPRDEVQLNCTLDEAFKELRRDTEIGLSQILFDR